MIWDGAVCHTELFHHGERPLAIKEVVWLNMDVSACSQASAYGEGYNMLSQYEGSLSKLHLIGNYGDGEHYRMPQVEGDQTVYNLLLLSEAGDRHLLLAYASCHRFRGEFRIRGTRLEAALCLENQVLKPGESCKLELFYAQEGTDSNALLEHLAECISTQHPPLPVSEIPTGWCSWYAYGPDITEEIILDNLDAITRHRLPLTYIQIDDGYQARMGDWLVPGAGFSSDMKLLCEHIRELGYEPAIWVAPFIAEPDSALYREHPDWFVQHESEDRALSSEEISFGGWRCGPWYMLDGSHPEACAYLTMVFRTMREEWGCRYFKLDANMWGALPGGRRYVLGSTSIEAYRSGMQAVLSGAGEGSFVLGCNAPMWPSLGLVHGMRVTDDFSRNWDSIKLLARQLFHRNWMHGRLWINDPDCLAFHNLEVVLPGPDGVDRVTMTEMTDEIIDFHFVYVLASGGMMLSGDRLIDLGVDRVKQLAASLPPSGVAATFKDAAMTVGFAFLSDSLLRVFLFNWEDNESDYCVPLPWPAAMSDLKTGTLLGDGGVLRATIPGRSARAVVCIRSVH
ncbi:glycoside hydrolase family 36 protein [Cohnella soli]|uniref:Alpha-galactosidase n=1 Tax=Cohnella soli TaxID=425005 RepID=A0ABW0HY41_9BACL